MNIRIITASAGTGKTHRLTEELGSALISGRARPDGVIATTFTTRAAAELSERARTSLLRAGHVEQAHQLLAARIGTVNAVCGSIVAEFAFELGISPAVHVLDDAAADVELRRALARTVSHERVRELDRFRTRFDHDRDWRLDVARIIEAARANALPANELAACAARSCAELDRCLGACTHDDLDGILAAAIEHALATIDTTVDTTKGTAEYVERLELAHHDLKGKRGLTWGGWASLAKALPTKRSKTQAAQVQATAVRHLEHPRLRAELHGLITMLFDVASGALATYQDHKRERGVIDFVDQEALALTLLRMPGVRDELRGQLDLVLVDEFQDTSPLQLLLFLELAKLATESIWVGDPKQAIYGFRGTDPALMDAAVESLISPIIDVELVERVVSGVGHRAETLDVSYRSRPALIALTNAIFAPAFAAQGIANEHTSVRACTPHDAVAEDPIVEYWPLILDRSSGQHNDAGRAAAVAANVAEWLRGGHSVRDRSAGAARLAGARDLAILCRTNRQCQTMADALGELQIPAIIPRTGLNATLEGRVARAGLALWIDPWDSLAAAELARIVAFPRDLDALVAEVLARPGPEAFRDHPVVARLAEARRATPDLGPVAALDAVILATELRALCSSWDDAPLRHANLDALRAHATVYVSEAAKSGRTTTLVGLLEHLDRLSARTPRWDQSIADHQALLAGEQGVTVMTWHRAKGLEWPVTVLFGLESLRTPSPYGLTVVSDRASFDLADPLGGRWLRFWPNPYHTANQDGAVRGALEQSREHAELMARADREALRVLYVGWTRARDRVIIAVEPGRLRSGILGKLPAGAVEVPSVADEGAAVHRWSGIDVSLHVAPARPRAAEPRVARPGLVPIGRPLAPTVPARVVPSALPARPSTIGDVIVLGDRIPLGTDANLECVGNAVHAFLAADRSSDARDERLVLARGLLERHASIEHLGPSSLLAIADRLWSWIANRFPDARAQREWPVRHRLESGTLVAGVTDLVLLTSTGSIVIDHKAFPGTSDQSATRAIGFSGQLGAYADAIRTATGRAVLSTWIHFPIRGHLVEVRVSGVDDPGCAALPTS